MLKTIKAFLVSAFMATTLIAATQASATSVNWTTEGGLSDFDTDTITFTGFNTNQLTSVVGSAFFHSHSTSSVVNFNLEVLLDGVWTSIFTDSTNSVSPVSGDNVLSSLISNVSFATGIVSGIRATGSPNQSQANHNWGNTVFNFNDVSRVPLPASLPLLAASIFGFGFMRRRAQKG